MKEVLTGLLRAIIILFILLVIMNVVKMMINKPNENSEEKEVEVVDTNEGVNVNTSTNYDNNYDYKSLFDKYNYSVLQENFGEDFGDKYFSNNLDNDFYLYSSIIALTKDNYILYCKNTNTVSETSVLNKIKELYNVSEFTPINYTNTAKTLTITYNEKDKNYSVTNTKCSGLEANVGHIDTVFLGGKTSDKTLEVYFNAHYIDYKNQDGLLKVIHYKDITPTSSIVENPNGSNVFTKYKMVFEKDGENTIFTKIEKVA